MKLRLLLLLAVLWCALCGIAHAQEDNSPLLPITGANQSATDALGRTLPSFGETGGPKANRWVGLFYWQWHGGLRALPGQFDMTQYLKTRPYFKDFTAFPPGGPAFPTFYWAQPLFGYYQSTDPWVIRKHLAMLADAGVDFLFLDYTNGSVYDAELAQLLKVAEELKARGVAVPRLAFFLNSEPDWKIEHLYKTWYAPGQHDAMWFRWRGKPLMMSARPADNAAFKDPTLIPAAQNFFTFRPTWAFHDAAQEPTKWRFLHGFNAPLALDPQGRPEQLVVAKSTGGPIWDNLRDGGVSAVEGVPHPESDYSPDWMLPDAAQGAFFQAGWNRAFKLAPPMLLVTGWNEWTASVWDTPGVVMLGRKTVAGQGHIVDEFNPQFNRDLEPMKDGYSDDYYWQFVANLRRYKGMEAPQRASGPRTMRMDGRFDEWRGVMPAFRDTPGDAAVRDWDAQVPGIHYRDSSARNDITSARVARDARNLYFYVRTLGPLSAPQGRNWMQLFVDADANPRTGWHGYDFLIGRTHPNGRFSVERYRSGAGGAWAWQADSIGAARGAFRGAELELAVPRAALGLKPNGALKFNFKWADNLPGVPDVGDFYTAGDVAPNARFNFRFEAR